MLAELAKAFQGDAAIRGSVRRQASSQHVGKHRRVEYGVSDRQSRTEEKNRSGAATFGIFEKLRREPVGNLPRPRLGPRPK